MKTELKRFCDDLGGRLEPFARTVHSTLSEMESGKEAFELKPVMDAVAAELDVVDSLLEKVRSEEAYLIIFGPLKSGKSTLMNAISGTYVSEVSSLPAYPCLVHVRHAEKAVYKLSRYDGTVEVYDRNEDLQQVVRDAHVLLATALIETEKHGEVFEPGKHFPEAIRDIDICLPATRLGEAAAVLVDTPGLYAKMRFGYDRLTKKFRDHASCAIFVVKADNLFLEQVFEEFNELLAFFSRIYLVVNIDKSRRDLTENGDLVPSLESRDPERIIATFESLSMNAQIRQAFEEQRLRIYPIDLLDVARDVLRGETGDRVAEVPPNDSVGEAYEAFLANTESDRPGELLVDPEEEDVSGAEFADADASYSEEIAEALEELDDLTDEDEAALERMEESIEAVSGVEDPVDGVAADSDDMDEDLAAELDDSTDFDIHFDDEAAASAPEAEALPPIEKDTGMRRFDQFTSDLESYLNGTDYLREFMSDHLRRGERIVSRYETVFSSVAFQRFERISETLEKETREEEARLASADLLRELDWHAALAPIRQEAEEAVAADKGRNRDRLQAVIRETIENWFGTDEALVTLMNERLPETIGAERKAMVVNSRKRVLALVDGRSGGVRFTQEQLGGFNRLGINLSEIYELAEAPLNEVPEARSVEVERIAADAVAVPRKIWDILLFRNRERVFKSIFGSVESPDKPVKASVKAKRLGEPVKARMVEIFGDLLVERIADEPGRDCLERLEDFSSTVESRCSERIHSAGTKISESLLVLRERGRHHSTILEQVGELRSAVRSLGSELGEVRANHLFVGAGQS